jgi:hypothetical protein
MHLKTTESDQLNCSPSEQQGGGTVQHGGTKVNEKAPQIKNIRGIGELTFLFQSSTEVAVCDHHQYGQYNTTEHAHTACSIVWEHLDYYKNYFMEVPIVTRTGRGRACNSVSYLTERVTYTASAHTVYVCMYVCMKATDYSQAVMMQAAMYMKWVGLPG